MYPWGGNDIDPSRFLTSPRCPWHIEVHWSNFTEFRGTQVKRKSPHIETTLYLEILETTLYLGTDW